jgi:hypothetical protein
MLMALRRVWLQCNQSNQRFSASRIAIRLAAISSQPPISDKISWVTGSIYPEMEEGRKYP